MPFAMLPRPAASATARSSCSTFWPSPVSAPAKPARPPFKFAQGEKIMTGFKLPLTFLGSAALGAVMLTLPALGQDAAVAETVEAVAGGEATLHTQFILNSFLMLFGGILVFWMAAGFAMLEAG